MLLCEIESSGCALTGCPRTELNSAKNGGMVPLALAAVAYLRAFFVPRHNLAREAAALHLGLAVFKRKQPRPQLHCLDRLFWIAFRRLRSGWTNALIMVKPETVVSWHRAGFRLAVQVSSAGKFSDELRQLIRRLKTDNPS